MKLSGNRGGGRGDGLVQDLASTLGTAAAAVTHAQLPTQLSHGMAAPSNRFIDMVFGHGIADADVHDSLQEITAFINANDSQ